MNKTFYLWDLADTLFLEAWDAKKSGYSSYDAYVESLGFNLKMITPRDYEWSYERPYREGLFKLSLTEGFTEVLKWTKHNGVFTTGNREQMDWRAEYLMKMYGFDVRPYVGEIFTTFDYGNTNSKTSAMLQDILNQKTNEGYERIVYTDDKRANCNFFLNAAKALWAKHVHFTARAYHLTSTPIKPHEIAPMIWNISSLWQLKDCETEFNYV